MKKIIVLLIILCPIVLIGQQNPQYTQYMYNLSSVNPAYAGSKDGLNANFFYRSQWVGITDAPKTLTLGIDAPLGKNVGAGLSVISDKLGPLTENAVFADVSYTLKINERAKLAFGVKAGANFVNADFPNEIRTVNDNDIAFQDKLNRVLPNFGAGVFYYSDEAYLGVSMPNILETLYFDNDNGRLTKASEKVHVFITSGYVFTMSDNIKFKPSTMIKATNGAPLSVDLSANILLNNKVEFGISSRLSDSFSAMFNVRATKKLKIGYAYDYIVSNLGSFSSGSHEVFMLFEFSKKMKIKSPRFF